MSHWISIDARDEPFAFPARPACYVIYLDGVLSYIGQTSNLRKRMSAHGVEIARYSDTIFTSWGQFRRVIVKAHFGVRFGDWAMRELRLIRRIQPSLNCVGSVKGRATA